MYKLLLIYKPIQEGQFFDEDHYHKIHFGEAIKFVGRYGCKRIEVSRVLPMDQQRAGRVPELYRTTELWFDTYEELKSCLASPEMTALNPDARNYTNVVTTGAYLEATFATFDENGDFAAINGPWSDYFGPKIGTDMGPLVYGTAEPPQG